MGRGGYQSSQFSGLVIIFTRLPEIWNFLDSSNSKNPDFLGLLNRITALSDVELPVDVL